MILDKTSSVAQDTKDIGIKLALYQTHWKILWDNMPQSSVLSWLEQLKPFLYQIVFT